MVIIAGDNLRLLFEQINGLGFFSRLFSWGKILHLNGLASSEFQNLCKKDSENINKISKLSSRIQVLNQEIEHQKTINLSISTEIEILKNLNENQLNIISQREQDIASLKEVERQNGMRIGNLENKNGKFEISNEQLQKNIQNYENEIGSLREASSRNNNKILELQQEITKNNAEIEYHIQEAKKKESEIGGLKEAVEKSRKEIQQYQNEFERAKTTIEENQKELQKKENEIGSIKEANARNEISIIELQQVSTKNNAEIEYHIQEAKKKESEIGGLKEAVEKSRKEIQQYQTELERTKTTIEQNQKELQKKENEIGSIKEANTRNETSIIELQQALTKNNVEIDHHIQEAKKKESEIGGLKEAVEKSRKEIQQYQTELERAKTTIEQNQKEFQKKENEIGTIRETNTKNEEKILDLQQEITKLKKDIDYHFQDLKKKEGEIGSLSESVDGKIKRIQQLDTEIALKTDQIKELNSQNNLKDQEITGFKKSDIIRQEQYEKSITELNSLKEQLDQDRLRVQKEREKEIEESFQQMKNNWKQHENQVELALKGICQKNAIEYIDKEKVPFRGKPDNSLLICNEYIIFDAKCPTNNDLSGFSNYIKNQAEGSKKYTSQKRVHKAIFLVVPTNTIDKISQIYYNLASYSVYVITIDALEPIILSLKKIEAYEIINQLTPEEKDNICRVIGKFAHATKRRIQIDSYFCNEFINILNNCENLPGEIKDKSQSFENADKMNPPLDKRAKEMQISVIQKDVKKLNHECAGQYIDIAAVAKVIETIPLELNENLDSSDKIQPSLGEKNQSNIDKTIKTTDYGQSSGRDNYQLEKDEVIDSNETGEPSVVDKNDSKIENSINSDAFKQSKDFENDLLENDEVIDSIDSDQSSLAEQIESENDEILLLEGDETLDST